MMDLVWFLLIGAIVGWLAGLLVEGKGQGFLSNMVIGVLGALIGGGLSRYLPDQVPATLGHLGMAVLGSIVLLVIIRLLRNSK